MRKRSYPIVADTITEIHQRSRGTYERRRVRAALLADYEMNLGHLPSQE